MTISTFSEDKTKSLSNLSGYTVENEKKCDVPTYLKCKYFAKIINIF